MNHHGEVVADAGANQTTISADVDMADLRAYRERFPALADIRPDFQGKLS